MLARLALASLAVGAMAVEHAKVVTHRARGNDAAATTNKNKNKGNKNKANSEEIKVGTGMYQNATAPPPGHFALAANASAVLANSTSLHDQFCDGDDAKDFVKAWCKAGEDDCATRVAANCKEMNGKTDLDLYNKFCDADDGDLSNSAEEKLCDPFSSDMEDTCEDFFDKACNVMKKSGVLKGGALQNALGVGAALVALGVTLLA